MGIRETINEKPGVATAVTLALILLVAGYIYYTTTRGGAGGAGTVPAQAFYSDDDGKSYFPDDDEKIPPFDRGGKEAVRARVYKCGGKTFVNHLERYTAEAKKKLEASRAASPDSAITMEAAAGLEVKSPGTGEWVRVNDPRAAKIIQPKCPDGSTDLEIVTP